MRLRRLFSLSQLVGLALFAAVALPAIAQADNPPYAIETFTAQTTGNAGGDYTIAGGHPDQNAVEFTFPHQGSGGATFPYEQLKDSWVTLPPGFFGNPAAATRCPFVEMKVNGNNEDISTCPPGSKVGTIALVGRGNNHPLYNVVPTRGYPAEFAFRFANNVVILFVTPLPRTASYGLAIGSANATKIGILGIATNFFGVPSEHGSGGSEAPFLTNPVDCSEAEPTWRVAASSWEHAGSYLPSGFPNLSDPDWKTATEPTPPVTGCNEPALAFQFDPSLEAKGLQGGGPVQADQPTGLGLDFTFPQSNDPTDLNTTFEPEIPQAPEPKEITVKLPAGLSISPSSADGLGACSDLASDPAGDQVHYDNTRPVSCPDSSKIGSASATSPLLASHDPITDAVNGAESIPGSVYLLKPHPGDLPVGVGNQEGKFRLLIQLDNPRYGVNFKLPGIATADPNTGQLTAIFTENPQLPSSHITVNLKEGPRAPLASPTGCGSFQTTSDLVPWSSPGTADAHPTASFSVSSGPNGTPCPAGPAGRPFAPAMSAGTEASSAGQSSPFVLKLTRNDGEQELSSFEATLPKGLAAKFIGVPYCSEASLAAAATRSGAAEQANPTCPGSRIGSVTVGAGPGSNPFYIQGNAYLAGPYKGAPMSVAVITPAVAGPFDLGAIVTRNALFLNPETAQGHIVSDPFPKILDGVPLRLRSIDVRLDRPNFTLNPTNCSPLVVEATLHSTDGASSSPTSRFQAAGCDKLGFKPSLKLSLKGSVSRRAHPSLKATLTARPGDANIASAQVKLPKSAFLDNAHIGTPCTRPQFTAKQCPASSVVGFASATTPLLGYELTGSVYLRSNPAHKLPDLVVGFNGPASQPIEIELAGKTDSVKGALRNTFEAVPDVPVTKFSLTLFGGKKGLIEMSSGFCASPKASIKFTGQNGMESNSKPKVTAKCPKGNKGNKGGGKKGKRALGHSHR